MKKNLIILLCVAFAGIFMFAGCADGEVSNVSAQSSQTASASSDNSASQALESPDTSAAENTAQPTADVDSEETSSDTASTSQSESNTAAAMANYNISDYEEKIVDLINRMEEAQMSDYKSLKKEARQISDEMDRTEDLAEIDYYNGKISNSDYIQVERELEVLEEMLDHAEDSMEIRLGIDD